VVEEEKPKEPVKKSKRPATLKEQEEN
jgi:hypothetical protein